MKLAKLTIHANGDEIVFQYKPASGHNAKEYNVVKQHSQAFFMLLILSPIVSI